MAEKDSSVTANMRARAEQCRRLAQALTDQRAAEVLLSMAHEIARDIGRLEGGGEIPKPVSPEAR